MNGNPIASGRSSACVIAVAEMALCVSFSLFEQTSAPTPREGQSLMLVNYEDCFAACDRIWPKFAAKGKISKSKLTLSKN
jgi:hypothetical protein